MLRTTLVWLNFGIAPKTMDLFTQAIFGAATYAVVNGPNTTGRDVLWGLGLGMLIDADVLLGLGMDEVEALVNHRSWSHALVVGLGLSWPLAWLRARWGKTALTVRMWLAVFAALHTHLWLDCLTAYGTQIWFPFSGERVAWNVVHVFHPMATVVLIAPWIWCVLKGKRHWGRAGRNSAVGFACFMVWPLTSKSLAESRLSASLHAKGELTVVPTPFNSMLWHGVANAGDSLGFATVHVAKEESVEWFWVKQDLQELERLRDFDQTASYLDFADGLPWVTQDDTCTRIYLAKFGPINYSGPPEFVFPLVIPNGVERGSIEKSGYSGPWSNADELMERLR